MEELIKEFVCIQINLNWLMFLPIVVWTQIFFHVKVIINKTLDFCLEIKRIYIYFFFRLTFIAWTNLVIALSLIFFVIFWSWLIWISFELFLIYFRSFNIFIRFTIWLIIIILIFRCRISQITLINRYLNRFYNILWILKVWIIFWLCQSSFHFF